MLLSCAQPTDRSADTGVEARCEPVSVHIVHAGTAAQRRPGSSHAKSGAPANQLEGRTDQGDISAMTTVTGTESAEFAPDQYAIGTNSAEVQAKVPFAMSSPLWVPKERYYDREFFELEKQ